MHETTGPEAASAAKCCAAILLQPINGTDTCWPVETPILYKLKSYGKLKHGSELGMMAEIRKNGCAAINAGCR